MPFQTLTPPLAPQSTFSLVGRGCGASSWPRPLGITAPGPEVRFFRRCGDRSPGAAPGTGREGVGWGQLLDTAMHGLRSGRAHGQEDTFEPESRSQALCSSSVCLQCPRPGWWAVAGTMALTGQRDQGAFSGGRGSNQDGHLGLDAAVFLDCSGYRRNAPKISSWVEDGLSVAAPVPYSLWSAWLPVFMLPSPAMRPQNRQNSQMSCRQHRGVAENSVLITARS